MNLAAQAAGMNPDAPATVAAAAAKRGMDLVDHDTHESLEVDGAEGRCVIAAGRRKHWIILLPNDENMADRLASAPTKRPSRCLKSGTTPTPAATTPKRGQWFY